MQPNHRRVFYALLLLVGLVWIFLSADRTNISTNGRIPAPQTGFLAPNFTLNTPDGNSITLSHLRGKTVLVNIWATWCPPCRAEMPVIQMMYGKYKDQEFVVLGINATNQDNQLDIMPFVREYGLTFPILLDETGDASRAYQLRSLPSSFFIGRDGVIKDVVIGGPMSEKLLKSRIEEILK